MKKLFSIIICLILESCILAFPVRAEEESQVASAYILMECTTGRVLNEYNSQNKLPVGSLAKLMTALIAGECVESGQWQLDTELTASDCVSGTKGAVIWLLPGDVMTVEELLKGLIIGNANDAAAVLAENISGSREDFVMDMNARAFDLGMRDTRFTSPEGYDDENSYSTASDIGRLCGALSEIECLTSYFTTWRDFLRDGATELVNENTFARTYDGMIGWKASHSESSGWCIAAGAEKDGMRCAAVVLGCPDEDSRFDLAKRLLKDGFSKYTIALPGFSSEFMKPIAVRGGTSENVDIETKTLSGLVVPKSDTSLKAVMVLPLYVHAPVEKGRKIGSIAFYNGDLMLLETDLVAKEGVEAMTVRMAVEKLLVKLCKL